MLQLLAIWSVDPRLPGADVPAAGVSLFDQITLDAQGRRVLPFPFERLIARIEAAAGCSASDPCTRAVLIPLGRSLQRVAASPDFFAHPRVVAAVVADGNGALLRDRLYLGYQDKANVIEVISYNEAAGRFEFQVVQGYGAGMTPTVAPARRTLCVACHQNHGPIFSRQTWLETNANPRIATALEELRKNFHGVPARGSLDIANAIDDSTDRASRLALTQKLWREGCGESEAGSRCRRSAYIAALQFALTGGRAHDATTIGATLQASLPSGIALPDADLPNRDPLAAWPESSKPAIPDIPGFTNISASFDPLVPRVPTEIFRGDDALADELIKGLSSFFTAASIMSLDAALPRSAPVATLEVPCSFTGRAFDCRADAAQFSGSLDTAMLDTLSIGGSIPLRHLQIKVRQDGKLDVRDGVRTARLPDGNAIESIELLARRAKVRVRADFSAVRSKLVPAGLSSAMVADSIAMIRGVPSPSSPAQRGRELEKAAEVVAAPALPFEPACGACHHAAEITPPNFLYGTAERVNASLDACAPRIHVRMAMHDVAVREREKSPMPPDQVASGEPRAADTTLIPLRRAIEERLRREYGRVPAVAELLSKGYESLRPCLPAS